MPIRGVGESGRDQMIEVSSKPPAQHRSSKFNPRRWVVEESDRRMLTIVGVVAAIVVAVLAWNGRNQPESRLVDSTETGRRTGLVADPSVAYRAPLSEPDARVWVVGTPDRLAVGSSAIDGSEGALTVFGGAGTALWSATFRDGFSAVWVEDDILVTTPGGSGGYQLSLFDGASGDVVWRAPTATADIAYHGGALYAVLADRVSMIDIDSGAVVKSIKAHAASTALATLAADGSFYEVGPATVQLWTGDLEPLGVPIPTAAGAVFARLDDGTVVANDGDLIRYDVEGVERRRWANPVAGIDSLAAVNESLLIAGHGQQVTMIQIGDEAVSQWTVTGTLEDVVLADETGYVATADATGRHAIYRAESGEEVVSHQRPIGLATNGYYLQTGSRLRAYSLPNGDLMYDSGAAVGQSTFVIDGGYVLLREAPVGATTTGMEMTVLS